MKKTLTIRVFNKTIEEAEKFLQTEVEGLEIQTSGQFQASGELLKMIKSHSKSLDTERKSHTQPLDEAKKEIMDEYRPILDRLENGERIVKRAMAEWNRKEQERLEKERREREEAARRLHEAEILKIQEQTGGLRERRDELQKKWNALRTSGDYSCDLLYRNAISDLDSQISAQEKKVEETKPVFVPPAPPPETKVEGISFKKVAKFRVADKSQVPMEYLIVDEKLVGNVVRSSGGKIAIPGIEIYFEDVVSARG